MNSDLKQIKKKYGEDMMHFCRSNFSSILEEDGKLFSLLESSFAFSHFLYDDVKYQGLEQDFIQFIYYLAKDEEEKELPTTNKTPSELFEELGYHLYECHTWEDVQCFRKYFEKDEELCTFEDKERLDRCHIFFAVKKNVDEIKRENFENPERQDEYGTSVMSIQFSKTDEDGLNVLSIKNRYNHSVPNADATFSNNLENITPGLTDAFTKKYQFNIYQNSSNEIEIRGYTKATDGKQYKYNYEDNEIYYGPNNIIIDRHKVQKQYLEKEKYIVMDHFVLDLMNKTIFCYSSKKQDAFIDTLQDIERIEIKKDQQNKIIHIKQKGFEEEVVIKLDELNNIISYKNNNVKTIGKNFLKNNFYLQEIVLNQVESFGSCFLFYNMLLKNVYFPNALVIDSFFINSNPYLENAFLPNVVLIGPNFLAKNKKATWFCFPNLVKAESSFLQDNQSLKQIYCPFLQKIPSCSLENAKDLEIAYFPSAEETTTSKSFKEKANPNAKIITSSEIQSTNSELWKYLKNNIPPYESLVTEEMKNYEKVKKIMKCLDF